jgi:hypothetical protein
LPRIPTLTYLVITLTPWIDTRGVLRGAQLLTELFFPVITSETIFPELVVVLVLAPKPVPPSLCAVIAQGELVMEWEITQTGAHVYMGLTAQIAQQRLETRVLAERLDKGADRKLDRISHLRLELGKPPRFESLVDPRPVGRKIEFRPSDQKIARSETIKRLEPARRLAEVAFKGLDIRRFGSDNAPPEDTDTFFHSVDSVISAIDLPKGEDGYSSISTKPKDALRR